MDNRMHFTDYDDRAKELKEVFDAYYEGVEENTDLSQELRELEEELTAESSTKRQERKNRDCAY